MIRPLRVLVVVALAGASLSASSRETYLACSLTGPENTRNEYSFALDPEKSTLFWVEGTQKFKVTRNTSTQLWASREMQSRDIPQDSTDFRLNRVTGAAEMNYLVKLASADAASCRKTRGESCNEFLVLPEKSESGTCKVVDRAVN
jgi:hypothetical protein